MSGNGRPIIRRIRNRESFFYDRFLKNRTGIVSNFDINFPFIQET
ncbi:hypothetical protein LEP1GSC060_0431 [Leptospira weilii serovar Ranarum str. ICFT]|uniref:Uncharacterized protein n=1 Tax=Leptospira weilii serovar Ranarum str. ICFT TaxID=1218598 RepID=N1WKX5_9LEPT|nr:hypothetical protein LEP1GSC060_0431 [Leptospira weilii serovar Ranarum str. ICFT]